MYWIDDTVTISGSAPPTPVAATNPIGWFTEGNSISGAAPTPVHADWLNAVQAEGLNMLAAAGVTASKTVFTQKAQAMRRLAAANAAAVSASGSLTADNAGLVLANASGGSISLALPAANAAGGAPIVFRVRRVDTSTNTVSLTLTGGNTWSPGAASGTLVLQQSEIVDLFGDGTGTWFVVPLLTGLRFAVLTASGTFVTPLGGPVLDLELWGGGAGSFASVSGGGGGGGGGGGYARLRASGVTPLVSLTVTIGGGGGAGTTGGYPGNGGTTSFGSYVSATGGIINVLNTLSTPPFGGSGGNGSGGDLNIPGSDGGNSTTAYGGTGGGAAMGGGMRATANGVGNPGHFPGGGAAGAGTASIQNGAAGAQGAIVVRW